MCLFLLVTSASTNQGAVFKFRADMAQLNDNVPRSYKVGKDESDSQSIIWRDSFSDSFEYHHGSWRRWPELREGAVTMEVAGLVVGLFGTVEVLINILKRYSDVIRLSDTHNAKPYSVRLRVERGKFETILQLLSQQDGEISPELQAPLVRATGEMARVLEDASKTLARKEKMLGQTRLTRFIKEFETPENPRELEKILERLSLLNDALLQMLPLSVSKSHHSDDVSERSGVPAKEPDTVAETSSVQSPESASKNQDDPVIEDAPPRKSIEAIEKPLERSEHASLALDELTPPWEEQTRGQMLQGLVNASEAFLLQVSEERAVFSDVSTRFRVWKTAIESEYLYDALDFFAASKPDRPQHHVDMGNLLFRSVIRINRVLIWWLQARREAISGKWYHQIQECTNNINHVFSKIPDLPDAGVADFVKANRSAAESARVVLETIGLVVKTLEKSVPSTTRIAREYSIQSENMAAADVTQLLDTCVELIDPAAEALSRVSKVSPNMTSRALQKSPAPVESLSILQAFNTQALRLRSWKALYREDIELKLADKNPAKLASLAEAIKNIVAIMSEVLSTLGDNLPHGIDEAKLRTKMEDLDTFVQSLDALGPQLKSIKVQSRFRKTPEGQVILNVLGEETIRYA
ncbi:hypothetical protein BX600DRAFT_265926 [Xylariales sp. PMI_506]|nr:hypothetical protein BX600DRAFT_265926 [Xylariales sp. PMI_506]